MQPFELSEPMGLARMLSFTKFSFRKAKVIWRGKWFIFFYCDSFLILWSSSLDNWLILNSNVNIFSNIFIITRFEVVSLRLLMLSALSLQFILKKYFLSWQLISFVSMLQLRNEVTSFTCTWNKGQSAICRKWVYVNVDVLLIYTLHLNNIVINSFISDWIGIKVQKELGTSKYRLQQYFFFLEELSWIL